MKTTDKHQFVRFVSLRGDESFGFICAANGAQALPDRDTEQRVIQTQCHCCGKHIAFDAGWFGWRLWFLPRRAFVTPTRRRPLTLSGGWSGETVYIGDSTE